MIICRKPLTLYDVDVVGDAALLALMLGAYFGVTCPAKVNADEYRDLAVQIDEAQKKLEQTSGSLSEVLAEIDSLRSGVVTQTSLAPNPDALQPFLRRAAALALQCDIAIAQVAPNPVQEVGDYLSADIYFTGRGGSLAFASMLDRLACENPYFALLEYSIKRARKGEGRLCELSWTLRLYMLKVELLAKKEARS